MELSFGKGALLLLLVAAVVAMLTRRVRLPYSVGLVLAGMGLAFLPIAPKITFSPEILFDLLLPPLLFEAALSLRWDELLRQLPVVLTLASAGVTLSGAVTAAGMHYLGGWGWPAALVFGALIAATDPVSVIATFREAGVHGRLRLLVESESLFNDGTAAVAFGVAVALAAGRSLSGWAVVGTLAATIGGALLCGAATGILALLLAGRTEDHLVELTVTTVAAYGSFLLAERLHFSGVVAVIAAGLLMGNSRRFGALSDRGREAVLAFWEYAAFAANSLIFLLIGMQEAGQNFAAVWKPMVVALGFVMLGRAVTVYPLCGLFGRSALRVSMGHQHALFWGGLRGALALALALALPAGMAGRAEIVTVSFGVVAFSVFVQGLSMRPLLRRVGEIP
jgi:CPA1 family monovalent cation:H+ antiporter